MWYVSKISNKVGVYTALADSPLNGEDENVETDVHLSVEGIVCKNLPA
jgi:hypothetical protein